MTKMWKAGIAVCILFIPAFVIGFLHLFGKNHFEIKTFYPKIDSASGKVIVIKGDTLFHTIPPFAFLDQDSLLYSSKELKDKIYVADFFFTRCGTICPKLTTSMWRVQDVFLNNKSIAFVSFTVDPSYDKPSVLKTYQEKKLGNAINNWRFLTGRKDEIYELAIKGYFLPVDDASAYNKKLSIDESFIHSEKLVLVDGKGQIRGYFDGTDTKEVDRLVAEIRVLLDNKKYE
jgi:protein SCO1